MRAQKAVDVRDPFELPPAMASAVECIDEQLVLGGEDAHRRAAKLSAPRLAPKHVVILPIYRKDEERAAVLEYCDSLKRELAAQTFGDGKVQVTIDDRDIRGGEKNWHHVKRGVPLRAEVGPRDIAANKVFLARRDTGTKEGVDRDQFVATIGTLLDEIRSILQQMIGGLSKESRRLELCHGYK